MVNTDVHAIVQQTPQYATTAIQPTVHPGGTMSQYSSQSSVISNISQPPVQPQAQQPPAQPQAQQPPAQPTK